MVRWESCLVVHNRALSVLHMLGSSVFDRSVRCEKEKYTRLYPQIVSALGIFCMGLFGWLKGGRFRRQIPKPKKQMRKRTEKPSGPSAYFISLPLPLFCWRRWRLSFTISADRRSRTGGIFRPFFVRAKERRKTCFFSGGNVCHCAPDMV